MPIIEPIIRPPAEADSFLLQVTVGCSANHCSFCGAYQTKPFRIQDAQTIAADIAAAGKRYPQTRRVFLLDGDALAARNDVLLPVLQRLAVAFPRLARVSSYANGFNITSRTPAQLRELSDNRLKLIYMGLESGSQDVINFCGKRSSVDQMIEAVHMARDAGIKASVMVLLGLGGRAMADEHVRGTIEALNRMQPQLLSLLSVMVIPNTKLSQQVREGKVELLEARELLKQELGILRGIELSNTVFRSNHASNYLPLAGRFPQDKQRLCDMLQLALERKVAIRPEWARGL